MTDTDIKKHILEMLSGSTSDAERELLGTLLERQLRLEQIGEELEKMCKDMARLRQEDRDEGDLPPDTSVH